MVQTRSMRKSSAVSSPEIKGGQKKNVEQKATPKTKKAGGAIPEQDHEMYRARLRAVKDHWKAKKNGGPKPGRTSTTSTTRVKKSPKKDQPKKTPRNTRRVVRKPRETAPPRPQVVATVADHPPKDSNIQSTTTRETGSSRRKDVKKEEAGVVVTAITVALLLSAVGWVPRSGKGESWKALFPPPAIVETNSQELWCPRVASNELGMALPLPPPVNVSLADETIPTPSPVVHWPSVPSLSMVMEETVPLVPSSAPALVAPHPTVVPVVEVSPEPVPMEVEEKEEVVVEPPAVNAVSPEPVETPTKPLPVGRVTEKDLVWMATKWVFWIVWVIVRFVVVRTLKTMWGSYGPNVRWGFLFVLIFGHAAQLRIRYYSIRKRFGAEFFPLRQFAKDLLRNQPTECFTVNDIISKYQRERNVRLKMKVEAHKEQLEIWLERSPVVKPWVAVRKKTGKSVTLYSDIRRGE